MSPRELRQRLLAKVRGFAAGEAGAAMIEFALVLPVMLMLFLGMIAWGYTLTVTDNMYDAARQAARELAVGTSNEAQAVASAAAMLAAWPAAFTITAQDIGTTGTEDVRVTITVDNAMSDLISVVPTLPQLNASVTMRKED